MHAPTHTRTNMHTLLTHAPYMCVHVRVRVSVCARVCARVCTYACTCTCAHLLVRVRVHVHVSVRVLEVALRMHMQSSSVCKSTTAKNCCSCCGHLCRFSKLLRVVLREPVSSTTLGLDLVPGVHACASDILGCRYSSCGSLLAIAVPHPRSCHDRYQEMLAGCI